MRELSQNDGNTENIIWLNHPQEVNVMEWALSHINCDSLILSNRGNKSTMFVVAYSLNREGNIELKRYSLQNDQYGIFGGLDESMLNYLGFCNEEGSFEGLKL